MNPQEYIDFSKQPKELINNVSFDSSRLWIDRKEYSSVIPLGGASQFGHQSTSGVVYGSNLNRNLVYHISDPERYMDGEDLYMRCNFRGVCTDSNDVALESYLDVGGIYSCFEELKVEMGNRTIELINEADKLNSALSLVRDDPHHVNYNLMDRADSVEDLYISNKPFGITNYVASAYPISINVNDNDNSLYDAKEGAQDRALIISGGNFAAQGARRGDIVKLVKTNGVVHYVQIADDSVINAGNVKITEASAVSAFAVADPAANDYEFKEGDGNNQRIASIQLVGNVYDGSFYNSTILKSARARVMNQADGAVRLTFRLNLESLRQMRYVPLRFLKAPLKITIRMKEAPLAIVLRDSATASATNKIGYKFDECELVVPMLTVNPKQIEIDQALVKSEGLKFHYLTYEHHQKEFARADATVNLTFQTNLSSVRYALFAITDVTLANSNTTNSQAHACNSTFYKNFLKQFRYQVGTERFPAYADVDVDEIFGSEALMLTRQTLNMRGHKEGGMRIDPWEYQDRDSEKFVVAVPFTKDDSPWSGVNLSLNYLELKMLFAGTPANLVNGALLHCWLAHDSLISITDQGVEVIS